MPPCPITLAIDDFGQLPAVPSGDGMYMTADAPRLQELLLQSLGDLRAASRVVRLSDLRDPGEADVVLRPMLAAPVRFSYEGWASSWWASGGLWLVTWIGGLAVDDSTYRSDMVVDGSYMFAGSRTRVAKNYAATPVDMTFLERNDFFSWPTLQSLILPPFLTTDQLDSTREALTRRAIDSIGLEVARYFKRDFEADSQEFNRGIVGIAEPVNGATVTGDTVTLRGAVTLANVSGVAVRVNAGDPVAATLEQPAGIGGAARRAFGCQVRGLRPGTNYIRIVVTADDLHSRTLVLTRTD